MQEGFAGPVVGGSEEAEQVSKFLEQEHDVQKPNLSYSDEMVFLQCGFYLPLGQFWNGGEELVLHMTLYKDGY